jgi:hypothetical protein
MATVTGTIDRQANVATAKWVLASGDTGKPVAMADYPDRTVQAIGTGTTVTIEGSNDLSTWKALNDTTGTAISLSSGDFAVILENPQYIRPVAASAGATVILVGSRG